MQYTLFDFLRAPLIPVLCADVAACSARDIHCCLIAVAAVRTFPDEFSVIISLYLNLARVAALLAEIALRIEFGIHDVVVDMSEQRHYRRKIVFHVRYFDIAHSASGRKLLEL